MCFKFPELTMRFYDSNSAFVRPKKAFGIGPDSLPHICTQIFGELYSVPSISPSEVNFRCACVCDF